MKIVINGNNEEITINDYSVASILKIKQVASPEMVSVQLNGEFVNKEDYQKTILKENDSIDFLYFMGGGQS